MALALHLVEGPLVEPVTIDELKTHLRIEHDEEDVYLGELIRVAREDVELYTRRQLLPATWLLALDAWCSVIELPRPPARSIVSITHYDSHHEPELVSPSVYYLDIYTEPGRLMCASGQSWPALPHWPGGILITYEAGYSNVDRVPAGLRHAIKLLAGALYENREGQMQIGHGVSTIEENPTLWRLLSRHRMVVG